MKGKKTGGRDWKPGESGNPLGRTPFPEDVRRAKKLNAAEVARMIDTFFYMHPSDVEDLIKRPDATILEKMIGTICIKAAASGDHFRLNFLFDRCVGKVTEKLNVKMPKPTVINLIGDEAKAVVVGALEDEGDEE